ncbi:hypothetical protein L6R50_17830 [Myxococcota bacterium]|nr:hypothetical protein [Myxococcota bacterium]
MATRKGSQGTATSPQGAAPQGGGQSPLDFLPVNFTVSARDRVKAMGGAPAFAVRARRWEDALRVFWSRVERAWERAGRESADDAEFGRRWAAEVAGLDLRPLRDEAEAFNRYFPVEADLPMDPVSGDYTRHGERFARVVPPTPEDVLARFPAARGGR